MSGDSGLGSKLLKRMGWTEGTAIGKSGIGIVVPIKPKLKVGTAGIGFRESERLCSSWWMDAFNKAAAASGSGVDAAAEVSSDSLSPSLQPAESHGDDEHQLQQSSLSSSSGKRRRQQQKQQQQQQLDSHPVPLPVLGRPYAAFSAPTGGAAATVLRNGQEETMKRQSEADDKARHSACAGLPQTPSDEDLLAACGGRTAHAAARFGLSLGGKLARVRAQDLRLSAAEPEVPRVGEEEEAEADRQGKERKRKRRRRERTEDSQRGESEAANA